VFIFREGAWFLAIGSFGHYDPGVPALLFQPPQFLQIVRLRGCAPAPRRLSFFVISETTAACFLPVSSFSTFLLWFRLFFFHRDQTALFISMTWRKFGQDWAHIVDCSLCRSIAAWVFRFECWYTRSSICTAFTRPCRTHWRKRGVSSRQKNTTRMALIRAHTSAKASWFHKIVNVKHTQGNKTDPVSRSAMLPAPDCNRNSHPNPNRNVMWSRLPPKSNRFFHGPRAAFLPNFVKIGWLLVCVILQITNKQIQTNERTNEQTNKQTNKQTN